MSLVHQALQKAAAEKQRRAPPRSSPQPAAPIAPAQVVAGAERVQPPPTAAPAPKNQSRSAPWLATGLLALAVITLGVIVAGTLRKTPATPTSREWEPGGTAPGAPASPPPAETRPASLPAAERWKLTGISKDPAGNYLAIINGRLRAENEYVDGAVIKQIERDRVTLEADGQQTVLRLF